MKKRTNYRVSNYMNKINMVRRVAAKLVSAPSSELINLITFKKSLSDCLNSMALKTGLGILGEIQMAKFELATKFCKETQMKLLKEIIEQNKDTKFGKKHNFNNIKTVEDFRKNIPVHTYDDLMPYIERHIQGEKNILFPGSPISYSTTSGTTGKPKYIPITKEVDKTSHQKMAKLFSYSLLKEKPKAFDKKILAIVSPAEEGRTPDGTVYGSTSGKMVKEMNPLIRKKYVLPYEVLTIEDYNAKYYCILLLGMLNDVTLLSSANPSTLNLLALKGNEWKEELLSDIETGNLSSNLKLPEEIRAIVKSRIKANPGKAKKLRELIAQDKKNKLRPKHYWPDLHLILCWTGGNAHVFIAKMRKWYGENIAIRDIGYLASEIRGSVPLTCKATDGPLIITNNFFEFVNINEIDDENPRFLMAHELKVGGQYYVMFTNKAGLYRYNINDIVEVKNFKNNTPTIIFVQKGKGVTNITGEKLYEQQVMAAVDETEKELGLKTDFYMALADVNNAKYELYAEFSGMKHLSKNDLTRFLNSVEKKLQTINIEYAGKRKSLRLKPMGLKVLDKKSLDKFKSWRVSQGIREAQFKTVLLTSNKKMISPLSVLEEIEIN
jgi:hypothetical protein